MKTLKQSLERSVPRFLRHWNRGPYNSCARIDLTFKPRPDSVLARKREERLSRRAQEEREKEREKVRRGGSEEEGGTALEEGSGGAGEGEERGKCRKISFTKK